MFPDLVGVAEAARILGVPAPRIARYREQGRMPPPVCVLRSTPLWYRDQVEAVAEGREQFAAPNVDVVGTAEAAEILDVDRSQIGRWRRKGKFPEPALTLAAGPVWPTGEILAWGRERGRTA